MSGPARAGPRTSCGPPASRACEDSRGAWDPNVEPDLAEYRVFRLRRAEAPALVATVPAQHSYGFESSVLLALLGDAAFDAGRPFYPADIAAALARVPRPRALVTTPFHLKALLLAGTELPPVDLVLSATAPLSTIFPSTMRTTRRA